jgi:hypothetical protein
MKAFVVSIDIKDGVYDIIHAYTTRELAEAYVVWQEQHSGDHCWIAEVDVEDTLNVGPMEPLNTAEKLF